MSWAVGHDHKWDRDIGYGVPAICDHPDCSEEIDRGLSYVCGSDPYGGDRGCGLYFCRKHLLMPASDKLPGQLCERCYPRIKKPFAAKQDVYQWLRWKLRDESWELWRTENPEKCESMKKILIKLKKTGVIDMLFADKKEIHELAIQCLNNALNRFRDNHFKFKIGDELTDYHGHDQKKHGSYSFLVDIRCELRDDENAAFPSEWVNSFQVDYDGDDISLITGEDTEWNISSTADVLYVMLCHAQSDLCHARSSAIMAGDQRPKETMADIINSIVAHVKNDNQFVGIAGFVDEPKGTKQESDHPDFKFEWVDQSAGVSGDYYYGQIYFPIDGKYLVVDFSC
jgi:hypothetical protein